MPDGYGYQFLGTTNAWTDTTFLDDGSVLPLYHGTEYCYRVVAFFADDAESYVSDEVCVHVANAETYGEDGEFCYDETDYESLGITLEQMKGYLGQLVKKGYITACEGCYFTHFIVAND
jgi:hypothetical protein